MLSSSKEGRYFTFSFLSPTQIMYNNIYNNIYKQIEKSEGKNQSVLIHPTDKTRGG